MIVACLGRNESGGANGGADVTIADDEPSPSLVGCAFREGGAGAMAGIVGATPSAVRLSDGGQGTGRSIRPEVACPFLVMDETRMSPGFTG